MIKKRILIFGGNGMLGRVFFDSLNDSFEIILLSRQDCDISSFQEILNQISLHTPDIIFNFAAYTDVEGAQGKGMLEAFATNSLGAQNVAKAAGAFGIPLIYISSDYVFDGESESEYSIDDTPHPINNYGMSKFLGEELSRREYMETIIVRTSALYGGPFFGDPYAKKNIINKLIEKGSGGSLQIVSDQFTLPTSSEDLTIALGTLIENIEKYEGETLHFVSENNSESPVSWYNFALEIKKYLPTLGNIEKITSDEYTSMVQRPKYGILKNTSDIRLPDWKISLKHYFENT